MSIVFDCRSSTVDVCKASELLRGLIDKDKISLLCGCH